MPTDEGLPAVGDVITSTRFAFANQSKTGNFLKIVNVEECPRFYVSLEQGGSFVEKTLSRSALGIDAYDKSRAHAEFIVQEARWSDNPVTKSTDACSGQWYVTAQRLKEDGNPTSERIAFLMCGLHDEFVLRPRDIQFVGTMHTSKQKK